MDALLIAGLVLVALAAGTLAGWLALQRGVLMRTLGEAQAGRDAQAQRAAELARDLEQAGRDAAALRQQLRDADERVARAANQATDLTARLEALHRDRDAAVAHARQLAAEQAAAQQRAFDEYRQHVDRVHAELEKRFDALAAGQLRTASEQFLQLAREKLDGSIKSGDHLLEQRRRDVEQLVTPIRDALAQTSSKLETLAQARAQAETALRTQIDSFRAEGQQLRQETARLVRALRDPKVRGHYGETQLRRVAELAGMRPYCDFVEQNETVDADGRRLRPDMVVRLPNGRELAIDAKANLQPYLDALEAPTPEESQACLDRFAKGVADQALALGRKDYWKHYPGSPDFVVMFVPGDQFVDEAFSRRPDLLELAAGANVILASPGTLIALLRAVAVGFREQQLAREARDLGEHVRELHRRLGKVVEHLAGMGENLRRTVERYNQAVGSYTDRFLPQVRRVEEAARLEGADRAEVKPVTEAPRPLPAGAEDDPR